MVQVQADTERLREQLRLVREMRAMQLPLVYMDMALQQSPLFGSVARDLVQRQPLAQTNLTGGFSGG